MTSQNKLYYVTTGNERQAGADIRRADIAVREQSIAADVAAIRADSG